MSSPKVTYSYANGSANTIRPTSVTYPDNTGGTRVLTYDYGTSGGMNDKLSRVESLGFGGTSNLVQPSYLGLGTPVRTNYTQPQVRWDLATESGANPYAGLDRFGRVIDNKWSNSSTSATLDQIKYTYDRASNRTTRENTVAKAQTTPKYFDELYGYDGSNRLTQMQRGQLAGTSSITNLQFGQDWGLDPTGNWQQFNEDSNGSGTNDLMQARTANPVNEITDITNSVGTPWVQPGYDAAGNMTTIPQGNEPEAGFTGVYDAWNRLVKLRDEDDNVVAQYAYDGLTRRIRKTTAAETRHYLYNASWQILEERREEFEAWDLLTTSSSSSSSSSTSSSSSSSSDNPNYDYCQYVWGLRYIDGLVFRDRQSTSGVERLYALQDANWNVDALVDTSGAVVERFSYTAYGVPTFLNPGFTAKAGSDYAWDVRYAGYKWDSESALYQVRYRYLQPALGTWVSRDPIGYLGGEINLSIYENKPFYTVDPYGLYALLAVVNDRSAGIHIPNWFDSSILCGDDNKGTLVNYSASFGLYALFVGENSRKVNTTLNKERNTAKHENVWLQFVSAEVEAAECGKKALTLSYHFWEWWSLNLNEDDPRERKDYPPRHKSSTINGINLGYAVYGSDEHTTRIRKTCLCYYQLTINIRSSLGTVMGVDPSKTTGVLSMENTAPKTTNKGIDPLGTGVVGQEEIKWGYKIRCENGRCKVLYHYGISTLWPSR